MAAGASFIEMGIVRYSGQRYVYDMSVLQSASLALLASHSEMQALHPLTAQSAALVHAWLPPAWQPAS